jgi:hypothetical protein
MCVFSLDKTRMQCEQPTSMHEIYIPAAIWGRDRGQLQRAQPWPVGVPINPAGHQVAYLCPAASGSPPTGPVDWKYAAVRGCVGACKAGAPGDRQRCGQPRRTHGGLRWCVAVGVSCRALFWVHPFDTASCMRAVRDPCMWLAVRSVLLLLCPCHVSSEQRET